MNFTAYNLAQKLVCLGDIEEGKIEEEIAVKWLVL